MQKLIDPLTWKRRKKIAFYEYNNYLASKQECLEEAALFKM